MPSPGNKADSLIYRLRNQVKPLHSIAQVFKTTESIGVILAHFNAMFFLKIYVKRELHFRPLFNTKWCQLMKYNYSFFPR